MGIKKGFLLISLTLVILALFALSLSIASEQRSIYYDIDSEQFKLEQMQLPLQFIDPTNIEQLTKIYATFALYKLADSLITHPEKIDGIKFNSADPADPEGTKYVNMSIFELMVYGNTSGYLVEYNSKTPRGYFYLYPYKSNFSYAKEENIYTFNYYFQKTSYLAKQYGVNLSWGEIQNFSISHLNYKTLSISYILPFSLKSKFFSISKNLKINTTISIEGFPDPYLAVRYRKRLNYTYSDPSSVSPPPTGFIPIDYGPKEVPYKNIYFSSAYNKSEDAAAKLVISGSQGLGWFYGPVVVDPIDYSRFSDKDKIYNKSKANQFIFATSNITKAKEQSRYFGAIILYGVFPYYQTVSLSPLIREEKNCLWCIKQTQTISGTTYSFYSYPDRRDIPFIIVPYDIRPYLNSIKKGVRSNLPEVLITSEYSIGDICSDYNFTSPSCTGIKLTYKDQKYSKSSIYNLNGPRDMAICGFYVPSKYGPSYLQRFTSFDYTSSIDKDTKPVSQFGIESFDVGAWAGGYLSSIYNLNQKAEYSSRLDYHFLLSDNLPLPSFYCSGVFIKGMPGLKSPSLYNSLDSFYNSTGRFCLTNNSDNPTSRYMLVDLTLPLLPGQLSKDCR
ncbi:MAG: hypothetical protein QXV83_04060 [Candidatus Anstonellaceae archaeon]